jgi:hypothetical protein
MGSSLSGMASLLMATLPTSSPCQIRLMSTPQPFVRTAAASYVQAEPTSLLSSWRIGIWRFLGERLQRPHPRPCPPHPTPSHHLDCDYHHLHVAWSWPWLWRHCPCMQGSGLVLIDCTGVGEFSVRCKWCPWAQLRSGRDGFCASMWLPMMSSCHRSVGSASTWVLRRRHCFYSARMQLVSRVFDINCILSRLILLP